MFASLDDANLKEGRQFDVHSLHFKYKALNTRGNWFQLPNIFQTLKNTHTQNDLCLKNCVRKCTASSGSCAVHCDQKSIVRFFFFSWKENAWKSEAELTIDGFSKYLSLARLRPDTSTIFDRDCDKFNVGWVTFAICFDSCRYAEYDESNDASLVSVNARFFNDAFPICQTKQNVQIYQNDHKTHSTIH